MSARLQRTVVDWLGGTSRPPTLGVAVLTAAYLSQFYYVADVAGGRGRLVGVAAAALVAGIVLGRRLDVRTALVLSTLLFVAGNVVYFLSVPAGYRVVYVPDLLVRDVLSFLTGMSVLQVAAADVWAISIAPVPTFLTWYFVARSRHLDALVVGGVALGFFVLTGDAGTIPTLVGVVGALLGVGLVTIDVPGGLHHQWDTVAIVLAAVVVLSLIAGSGGTAQPLFADRDPEPSSIERTLVGEDDSIRIVGSVSLDPEIRFTVESERAANWRTDAYDRYTGDGWVRTGTNVDYEGTVERPPGPSERLTQRVTPEIGMTVVPAAWKPVEPGEEIANDVEVTPRGDFHLERALDEGETYTVTSEVPTASSDELRRAGTDDPPEIRDEYTQLPSSTPDRVGEFTEQVLEDADTRYEKAVLIEEYLQSTKEYSLDVERPDGDIADGFLFEMEAGYCTYFATTMVAMLRTQEIPARFVTGYTTGEQVDDDEYVVRGMNSHAWVEVYFPNHGWVEFDPTPSDPREDARDDRLSDAREDGEENVDTDRTAAAEERQDEAEAESNRTDEGEPNETASVPEEQDRAEANVTDDEFDAEPGTVGEFGEGGEAIPDPRMFAEEFDEGVEQEAERSLPDSETVGYGTALLVGLFAGIYRFRLDRRTRRTAKLLVQPRTGDPEADVERAFERLEILLAKRYRSRRSGETPRAYVESLSSRGLDERAHRVLEITERARYAPGSVSRARADEAVSTVNELVLETTPILRRLRRSGR